MWPFTRSHRTGMPAQEAEPKPCGLINEGMTCYLNAVLQMLFMTDQFRDSVLRLEDKKRRKPQEENLPKALADVFRGLQGKQSVSAAEVIKALNITDVSAQQDAAEYLQMILHRLPEQSEIFKGLVKTSTECSYCKKAYESETDFLSIPLSINTARKCDVINVFQEYLEVNKMNGEDQLYCIECNLMRDMEMRNYIIKWPDILTLQLKRSGTYDMNIPPSIKCGSESYELYAIINHHGSSLGGHYDAVIKDQRGNWYQFNDQHVKRLQTSDYQRSSDCSAYLLMYRKEEATPTQTKAVEEPSSRPQADTNHGRRSDATNHSSPSEMLENAGQKGTTCKSMKTSTSKNPDNASNKQPKQRSVDTQNPSQEPVSSSQMFKRRLEEECQHLNEENSLAERKLMNHVYIKSQITEEPQSLVSNKREIECRNMFSVRTVLMKGDAGIGKTTTVQKFILDWAEEKSHPDIKYIFPLSFQKLNMINEVVKQCSFMQILHRCFEHIEDFNPDSDNIMLIFDGLSEFKCALDFRNTKKITDINEPASVSTLLINLIMGNLLPHAQIWITTRPAAAQLIPAQFIDRVMEIHGFNDQQKEEYFRKSIRDQTNRDKFSHIMTSRRINSMCYSPDYCRIIAAIPERIITTRPDDFPKTLTQMYSRLLLALTEGIQKRRETIIAVAKLALHLLVDGRTVFTDEDLKKHNIRDESGLTRSSIIKKIEDRGNDRYFSFVNHRTQEFLAALYVTEVINEGKSLKLNDQFSLKLEIRKESFTDYSSLQQVMEVSLVKQMDLFFCFLLGLTLESSQKALRDLLKHRISSSSFSQNTAELVEIMKSLDSADRRCLLFDALKELDEPDLIQKIKTQLKSADSPAGVELLNSKERLNVPKSQQPEECPEKLQQGEKASREHECDAGACAGPRLNPSLRSKLDWSGKGITDSEVKKLSAHLADPHCKLEILRLRSCHISEWGLAVLSSALTLNLSHLRELDLSGNEIKVSALMLLSGLMADHQCKLEKLRLGSCHISDWGLAVLSSAMTSNSSHLRELDLSGNYITDLTVKQLSALLADPLCKLEKLRLSSCHISDWGLAVLSSAMRSNQSYLRELDLSDNYFGYSSVEKLSAVLADPLCKLKKLRLRSCYITDSGFADLISALKLNPSHLRELDLSGKFLGYSEVEKLLNLIADPQFKLEKLGLRSCYINDRGFADLISALTLNPSHLRELDLSDNKITDSGVKQFSALLEDPQCKLKILGLMLENQRHADQTSHKIKDLENDFQNLVIKH